MRRRATQKRGRRRLEGIQPRTDGGRAGCPHRRGSEAAEPPAPGPVGPAHRSAVFDSEGIRSECGRKGPECRKASQRPANKGDCTIHIGYTPGCFRGSSGTWPSGHGAREQERRQKEKCRKQKAEGKGRFQSAATAQGYAIQPGLRKGECPRS